MKSIGNIITDDLTNRIRPSECWSSAISHSVADSVGNKKTNHRRNINGLIDDDARQKNNSRENITDGIHPFAFSMVITDGLSVGDGGMAVNVSELWQIPTDIFRR